MVKSLIENNDFVRMRLIHAGAKLLAKQDKGEVQFRVLDEALETIMPYLKEDSILHGDLEDLKILLREQYPFFSKFPEAGFRSELEKQCKPSDHPSILKSLTYRSAGKHPCEVQ
jgi:multisite-specific tRNA:(cytosine-C5)-methyltransferase